MHTTFSRRLVGCVCAYMVLYVDWRLGVLVLSVFVADDIYMNGV